MHVHIYACACIINIYVPHEVTYQREAFMNNELWTSCSNPKGTDMNYPKWELVLGAPDRVNIPCLMHDTRLCQ